MTLRYCLKPNVGETSDNVALNARGCVSTLNMEYDALLILKCVIPFRNSTSSSSKTSWFWPGQSLAMNVRPTRCTGSRFPSRSCSSKTCRMAMWKWEDLSEELLAIPIKVWTKPVHLHGNLLVRRDDTWAEIPKDWGSFRTADMWTLTCHL